MLMQIEISVDVDGTIHIRVVGPPAIEQNKEGLVAIIMSAADHILATEPEISVLREDPVVQ